MFQTFKKLKGLGNSKLIIRDNTKNVSNLPGLRISIILFQLRPPALTFRIAQEYFENNLSDEEDLYTFVPVDGPDGGFYDRTIHQDDLTLSFDTETDGL